MIEDIVDKTGRWLLEVNRVRTISGRMWKNIQIRTKINGSEQSRRSNYIGCINGFSDFQEFVVWHRKQKAYGLGWELDKDLLVKGNKIYSQTTCVLLPKKINTLLTNRSNCRGEYPIGVRFDKRSKKFGVSCSNGEGVQEWLGTYSTVEDAFQKYKEYKENLCKKLAETYKQNLEISAYDALFNFKVNMED